MRVARSRRLVAEGYALATVARVMRISRQALYRVPTPRAAPQRRAVSDPVEAAIVEEALAHQTDGYRMVCAFVRRKLGVAVNRKRVLRVMRERELIQRRRPVERRRRPGFFRVERPRQLWQLDMTSIWVAEHGWCYLNAIIDCCTREIVAWQLELRCRADEAIAVVEQAAAAHAIQPGELVLGSDNGSAFTARRFRARLGELGIRHRRGGYRDPQEPGLHRELVRETQRTGGLAERVRDARRRPPRHRRLRRPLPPPPAQRAQLPDAPRGAPDLGGSPGTTKTSGLTVNAGGEHVRAAHPSPRWQAERWGTSQPNLRNVLAFYRSPGEVVSSDVPHGVVRISRAGHLPRLQPPVHLASHAAAHKRRPPQPLQRLQPPLHMQ